MLQLGLDSKWDPDMDRHRQVKMACRNQQQMLSQVFFFSCSLQLSVQWHTMMLRRGKSIACSTEWLLQNLFVCCLPGKFGKMEDDTSWTNMSRGIVCR